MDIKKLILKLSQDSTLSPQEAKRFIKALVETIKETVAKGESVRILKLGLFRPKNYRSAPKRTPEGWKKQKNLVVPHFKVGDYLKEKISQ